MSARLVHPNCALLPVAGRGARIEARRLAMVMTRGRESSRAVAELNFLLGAQLTGTHGGRVLGALNLEKRHARKEEKR